MTEDEAICQLAKTTILSPAMAKDALSYLVKLRTTWEVKAQLVTELTTAAWHTGDPSRLWSTLYLVNEWLGQVRP